MDNFKEKFDKANINFDKDRFESITHKSLSANGEQESMIIVMEELAELSQATSKQLRNKGDYYNLIEEMADVIISLQLLKDNYNISKEDLIKSINTKIDRIDNRIKRKIE